MKLAKKDYAAIYSRQQSDRATVETHTKEAKRAWAAIDTDLPMDVQQKRRARIQEEYRSKMGPLLPAMRERADKIVAQAPFYAQPALLRRAGLDAPMQLTLIVQRANDAGLVQLAAEAASEGNVELAGAIALEVGARSLSMEHSRAVGESLAALQVFDVADLDERLFRPVRDAYLRSELDALDVLGSATGIEKLTFARDLGKPVLT